MITKIELTNWKSFGHAELLINPLTVLIGANDSGKSNLLEALWFISQLVSSRALDNIAQVGIESGEIRGVITDVIHRNSKDAILAVEMDEEYGKERVRIRYQISIARNVRSIIVSRESAHMIWVDESNRKHLIFETTGADHLSFKLSPKSVQPGRPTHYGFDNTRPVITQVVGMKISKIAQDGLDFIQSNLQGLRSFDPQPSRMRTYSKRSLRLESNAANIAGFMAELPEIEQDQLNALISEQLRSLLEGGLSEVYATTVLPVKVDAVLIAVPTGKDGEPDHGSYISANLLSDGTLRYLALVVATATAKPRSLLAFEEVDDGLHPSRAQQLVSFLIDQARERGVDIILTTHNVTVLDAFGPEIVPFTYLVRRNPESGNSELIRIIEIEKLPQLLGLGGVGAMAASGRLNEILP